MKSFNILHILPESGWSGHFDSNWASESLDYQPCVSSGVAEKLIEGKFDLIIDSGAVDLLRSLAEGGDKQSNRFLEAVGTTAKVLVDLGEVCPGDDRKFLDLDLWDQLGKQLAWRFCALDRPVWVRFSEGSMGPNQTVLEESLRHWTGPGLVLIRTDALKGAVRFVMDE